MNEIKKFAKCVIRSYNFSTNSKTGFSCYIPDLNEPNHGFIIWVYSEYHKRFETHFQNLFSSNRMNVINQFNVKQFEYSNLMYDSVLKFISELDNIYSIHKIGRGINNTPINQPTIFNRAISFDFIKHNHQTLRDIEIVFTNNSLIDYICLLKKDTNIPLKNMSPICYNKIFAS